MTPLFSSAISYLNTHKASIKNCTYGVQCALASAAFYQIVNKKIYSYEKDETIGTPGRLSHSFAQVSFICTAVTTPWAVAHITTIAHKCFTADQLLKWCGSYTTFEGNWKHPRHLVSLLGAVFAIPAAGRCLFCPAPKARMHQGIQWAAFVSLLISRPFLHQANRLAHFALSKIT